MLRVFYGKVCVTGTVAVIVCLLLVLHSNNVKGQQKDSVKTLSTNKKHDLFLEGDLGASFPIAPKPPPWFEPFMFANPGVFYEGSVDYQFTFHTGIILLAAGSTNSYNATLADHYSSSPVSTDIPYVFSEYFAGINEMIRISNTFRMHCWAALGLFKSDWPAVLVNHYFIVDGKTFNSFGSNVGIGALTRLYNKFDLSVRVSLANGTFHIPYYSIYNDHPLYTFWLIQTGVGVVYHILNH
jgi:hypothetical protein